MLSTLLLQMPATDVLETSSPPLGSVSQQASGSLPEAFAEALHAAVAKLSPKTGVEVTDTPEPAGATDLESGSTPADTPADPLALLHTEQVRYQLGDIARALPAAANSTLATATAPAVDASDTGSLLPPRDPASGNVLPVSQPVQAAPPKLDSSAAVSSSIDVSTSGQRDVGSLSGSVPATHSATLPTAPTLSSSLTIQPTTPVLTQPGELSPAVLQAGAPSLPAEDADERIENPGQTKPANSEFDMARPSIGSERPELLLRDQASAVPAAKIQVLTMQDISAGLQTSPAPAPAQMVAAGNAAFNKVPTPAISASERVRGREPQSANGSILEATNVAIQKVAAPGSTSISTSGVALPVVQSTAAGLVQMDGMLIAAQSPTTSGPIETSAASMSALEKSTEGAATQLRVLTLTQTDELGDKLGALLASVKHIGKSQLSIQLHPQELGRLEVRIAPGAEQALNVSITAQHSATRDLVEAHLHRLRSALDDQGYTEVHVEVGQDRDNAAGHQQQAAEEQPTWPFASAAGQAWGGASSDTQPGTGLESSQTAVLGPGIDAYA